MLAFFLLPKVLELRTAGGGRLALVDRGGVPSVVIVATMRWWPLILDLGDSLMRQIVLWWFVLRQGSGGDRRCVYFLSPLVVEVALLRDLIIIFF